MLYVRGNHDYDHWQGWETRLELSGCLTYFKKSEHSSRGAAYHGVDGLSVTDLIAPTAISQRFIDAAALGYDYNPDFNGWDISV